MKNTQKYNYKRFYTHYIEKITFLIYFIVVFNYLVLLIYFNFIFHNATSEKLQYLFTMGKYLEHYFTLKTLLKQQAGYLLFT